MADIRLNYEIYDYGSYDLTKVPLLGQHRFFSNVITGQIEYVYVIGNGSNKIEELSFSNTLVIATSSNVDLENLRISGNRVKIINTGSSTINIEIGTTLNSIIFYLQGLKEVNFYFNGSVWIHNEINVITMSDSDLTLDDLSGPTKIILPSSGITANRTVNLPTLADNQNQEIEVENKNSSYILTIDPEGSETINGKATIGLQKEWIKIDNDSTGWNSYERSQHFYSVPYANRSLSVNGTGAGTFTDIDFSSFIEYNRIPTRVIISMRYDTNQNWQQVNLRPDGSTESNGDFLDTDYVYGVTGLQRRIQIECDCDENGIIEYKMQNTAGTQTVKIAIIGYWYK